MFSTQSGKCIPIFHIFDMISLFAFKLEEPKIGISGEGLSLLYDFAFYTHTSW